MTRQKCGLDDLQLSKANTIWSKLKSYIDGLSYGTGGQRIKRSWLNIGYFSPASNTKEKAKSGEQ